jgi:hypothetical protein
VMTIRIAQPTCRALQHCRSCVVGSLVRRNLVGALSGVEENRREKGRGSEQRAECKAVLAVVGEPSDLTKNRCRAFGM